MPVESLVRLSFGSPVVGSPVRPAVGSPVKLGHLLDPLLGHMLLGHLLGPATCWVTHVGLSVGSPFAVAYWVIFQAVYPVS